MKQTNQQLASLQVLADEVGNAYGMKKALAGSPDLIAEAPLVPTLGETLAEYSYSAARRISPDAAATSSARGDCQDVLPQPAGPSTAA